MNLPTPYEVKTLQKKLLNKIQAAEGLDDSRNVESVLRDLATTSEGLNVVVQELLSLYAQDVNHDFGDDVLLTNETLTLQRAYALMERWSAFSPTLSALMSSPFSANVKTVFFYLWTSINAKSDRLARFIVKTIL